MVFLPFFEGKLSLTALLSPHNEHRCSPLMRVFALAQLLLNDGQWDNQVQMVSNAMLDVLTLGGFGWMPAGCWAAGFGP